MEWLIPFYNYRLAATYAVAFANGIAVTAAVSMVSFALSVAGGVALALCRRRTTWLCRTAAAYVEIVRSTPLLVQLYVLYFGIGALPLLGRRMTEMECGVLALSLNAAAYMSEIIRAGIDAVPAGQAEAARALGLKRYQCIYLIILPQAIARIIPPLVGQAAILVKDSSIVSFIGVTELTASGLLVMTERLRPNEGFLTIAAFYLVIYVVMLYISTAVERRLRGDVRASLTYKANLA